MSSVSLRPVLRPSTLYSLPCTSTLQSSTSICRPSIILPSTTTYTCASARSARLLRRPRRPYTFTQLITLSDGSAFTIRTTSPQPVYRATRDTRNAPLWNPSSKELMNVEDDEAGRLAGFRARFGTMFDAAREVAADTPNVPKPTGDIEVGSVQQQQDPIETDVKENKQKTAKAQKDAYDDGDVHYDFGEDDANLLDLISSYGQQPASSPPPAPAGKKGKK